METDCRKTGSGNHPARGASRARKLWIAAGVALGLLALPDRAAAAKIEISFGFAFSHTNYSEENYSWNRRWGLGAGYNFTDYTQIEFAFQDVIDRTKITGYEDTTFHDQIYSVNWVQSFTGKNYFVQPYVKLGIGQLNREANGNYAGGAAPPARVDSITAVMGAGLKIYLTKNLGLRGEATSYLTGARLGTWKDNYAITTGISLFF
jgi:hypothetical protein